jgi:hypothetical protein
MDTTNGYEQITILLAIVGLNDCPCLLPRLRQFNGQMPRFDNNRRNCTLIVQFDDEDLLPLLLYHEMVPKVFGWTEGKHYCTLTTRPKNSHYTNGAFFLALVLAAVHYSAKHNGLERESYVRTELGRGRDDMQGDDGALARCPANLFSI